MTAARRYNVVTLPALRLLGLSGCAFAAILHHWLVGPAVPDTAMVIFVAGVEIYCLASWALLAAVWERVKERVDIPFLLLILDVVACVLATYLTGAERSWLFFLIVLRLTDASYGPARTLALAHMAPALYVAMLWYVAWFDGREIPFGPAAVNTFTLYATALYFAVTGQAVGALRARVVAAVRTSRDLIAQLEDKSRRLEVSMDKANEAIRAKDRLLATVSHELRTPLTEIIAQTELVMDEADPVKDAPVIADLAPVVLAARHLSGVIDDLLDVSRIEAGPTPLNVERFDVVALVDEVAAAVAPAAALSNNTLDVTHSASSGWIRTDRGRLRQILLVLLGNAAKFTSVGKVKLHAGRSSGERGESVVFRVSDTGIGIPSDIQPLLFTPFTQADSSTTRQYGGAGLGLAIAKRNAELIGATLSYESAPGIGTTFTVTVPADLEIPGVPPPARTGTLACDA